jgi:hypothetical protein
VSRKYVVGVVTYHGDETATQQIWIVSAAIAAAVTSSLGKPDADTMMSKSDMDRVQEAMSSAPTVFKDEYTMTFICDSCRVGKHEECLGGNSCDCQHRS